MVDALIVSNLALWVAVLVLSAVVLALVRQIGVLHERVAPAGALLVGGPKIGERAPELALVDWSGAALRVGGAAPGRRTLLFFASPRCPVCKALLPVLESLRADQGQGLRIVVASDGPRAEHEEFVQRHGLERFGYVLSGDLGRAFQVGRLPYAVLIDEVGVVRAAGLVNSREHLESLFEAEALGAATLQEYVRRERGRRVA